MLRRLYPKQFVKRVLRLRCFTSKAHDSQDLPEISSSNEIESIEGLGIKPYDEYNVPSEFASNEPISYKPNAIRPFAEMESRAMPFIDPWKVRLKRNYL